MLNTKDIATHLLRERLGLIAHVYSVVGNYHLAEDIFQEICVRALDQAGEVESKQHLLNWFRKSARNRAIDHLRSRAENNHQLSQRTLDLLESEWEKRDDSRRTDLLEALSRCVDQLTPRSREVVSMRYFQNRSGEEIASRTGLKVTSVYQTVARVHKALADCVQQQPEYGA